MVSNCWGDDVAALRPERGEIGERHWQLRHDATMLLRVVTLLLTLAAFCAVGVRRTWEPGASEMISGDLEKASRSWDQAHKDMAEYEQRWHLSRYTEEDDPTKWEDGPVYENGKPVKFKIPRINNEPTRNDLGYWSTTKQPTPVWVDLPKVLSKPGPGEPQEDGVPDSGTSEIRWGAPVVRKMPEAFLEQIKRMHHLLTKVKQANMMSNALLDKEVGEINSIKMHEQSHADTVLGKLTDDLNFIKPKIMRLKPKAGHYRYFSRQYNHRLFEYPETIENNATLRTLLSNITFYEQAPEGHRGTKVLLDLTARQAFQGRRVLPGKGVREGRRGIGVTWGCPGLNTGLGNIRMGRAVANDTGGILYTLTTGTDVSLNHNNLRTKY